MGGCGVDTSLYQVMIVVSSDERRWALSRKYKGVEHSANVHGTCDERSRAPSAAQRSTAQTYMTVVTRGAERCPGSTKVWSTAQRSANVHDSS